MRLVCPNCGAQYEIDDRVMPENGRDVQCSACGHAWFQRGPNALEEPVETPAVEAATPAKDQPSQDQEGGPQDTPSEDAAEQPEPAPEPEADPVPARRELNPDVQTILQEEAQRELEARQAQQEQIETQTEMGLDEVDEGEAQRQSIRERMARLRGADDEFEATEALPEGRGRDLLPDIEEINSTLDAVPDSQPEADPALAPQERPSGFRRGFISVFLIAVVLMLLYTYAPAIAEALPQVKAPLDSYVSFVDQARVGLNGLMESAIQKMQGASGQGG